MMISMVIGRHRRWAVLAVINLKGGTSKTTSAVFLAHVLREQGQRVLLVDADPAGTRCAAPSTRSASWATDCAPGSGDSTPYPPTSPAATATTSPNKPANWSSASLATDLRPSRRSGVGTEKPTVTES